MSARYPATNHDVEEDLAQYCVYCCRHIIGETVVSYDGEVSAIYVHDEVAHPDDFCGELSN